VVIHAFGAFFGLGAIFFLTSAKEFATPIEAGPTTDRFSMVGSMMLWVFWPSFCAAMVAPADVPKTAVNVIMALCASTLSTYLTSVGLPKKIAIADIANAALAGGVAIGSTCDKVQPLVAFGIGILAGGVSTFGFTVVQPRLQAMTRTIDTCGVLYLHGLPGLFGGIVAMFAVNGINMAAQMKGIVITVVLAMTSGLIAGRVISLTGRRIEPYLDKEEFLTEQAETESALR
jgi:ammonium transporter Rh